MLTRWRIAWGTALIAAGLTAYQLSRPGMLFGPTADIAVYLGAAIRLLHGAVPYRDFVFVQPPGAFLVTGPFAALSNLIGSRDALAALRLTTPVVAAMSALLTARLLHERGAVAVLVGCSVMALLPAELYALGSVLLEAWVNVLCLLAMCLAFQGETFARPRRLALAGALLGFAIAIKLPAVIPFLVLAVLMRSDRHRLIRFVAGCITGFVVPSLPFIALAPGSFVNDVVASQLSRVAGAARTGLGERLGDVIGLGSSAVWFTVAGLVVLAALVVMSRMRQPRAGTPLERCALATLVVVAIFQLVPAQYYPHYAALLTPFIALVAGTSLARLRRFTVRRAPAAVAAVAAAALLLGIAVRFVTAEAQEDRAAQIDALVPSGACAISDSPKYLVTSDRFTASARDCTQITDPFGTVLALGDAKHAPQYWRTTIDHADYIVTTTPFDHWYINPGRELLDAVSARFHVLLDTQGLLIYARVDHHIAVTQPGTLEMAGAARRGRTATS